MSGTNTRTGKTILVALLTLTTGVWAGEYNKVAEIGMEMPQFGDLPASDGTTLSSDDLDEKVVVLVFLANHCPWVKGMDGDLVSFVESFEGEDVRVVGVSVNHREEDRLPAMKAHGDKAGYNFTYIFDESQELGRKLGATRTPEYFVFDESRKLTYMGLLHNSPAMMRSDGSIHYTAGEPSEFFAQEAVAATLAGQEVDPAETKAQGCSVEYESVEG